MQDRRMMDHLNDIRTARTGLEAALAVSESEPARAAWRLYHQALTLKDSQAVADARQILDETIVRSDDEQLVRAKSRYDSALRGDAAKIPGAGQGA